MKETIHKAYRDPTADEAIGHVMREENRKYKMRVFICSPFAGDTKRNMENARQHCLFAVHREVAPFAPHLLYPQFMEDSNLAQRDAALRCGLAFLRCCKELWVFGRKISPGMNNEIQMAKNKGIPVRYFDENYREYDCKEVHRHA